MDDELLNVVPSIKEEGVKLNIYRNRSTITLQLLIIYNNGM